MRMKRMKYLRGVLIFILLSIKVRFLILHDREKLHVVPHADVGSVFVLTVVPGTGRSDVGCVVAPVLSVLCDQSDQMESPPLHSPGFRLSGCQDHNYELPVNWRVMEFNIAPDIISSTSKWEISFSVQRLLCSDYWLTGSIFIMKVIGWKVAHYYSIIWSFGCLR